MHPLKQRIKRTSVFRWYKACRVSSRIRDEFGRDEARHIADTAYGPVAASMASKQLEAQIIKNTHRIEMGLALPAPKRSFGADLEAQVRLLLPRSKSEAPDSAYIQEAEETLTALRAWSSRNDISETTRPIIGRTDRSLESPKLFFGNRVGRSERRDLYEFLRSERT